MDTITRMDPPRRAAQARAKACTNLIAKPMRMTAANLEGEGGGGTSHTRTRARHTKHTSPGGGGGGIPQMWRGGSWERGERWRGRGREREESTYSTCQLIGEGVLEEEELPATVGVGKRLLSFVGGFRGVGGHRGLGVGWGG